MYRALYADPPWHTRKANEEEGWRTNGGKGCQPAVHYPTMKTKDIQALDVGNLAADDSWLFLWVLSSRLADGLDVMTSWGFNYITNICWTKMKDNKLQTGIGYYVRGSHELLLIGKRGKPQLKRPAPGRRFFIPSVVIAERTTHSRKPFEFYDIIEKLSDGPYLELFARQIEEPRSGWEYWGNDTGLEEKNHV